MTFIHTHTHTHIHVTVPSLIKKKKKIELDNTRNLYSITMGEEGEGWHFVCIKLLFTAHVISLDL